MKTDLIDSTYRSDLIRSIGFSGYRGFDRFHTFKDLIKSVHLHGRHTFHGC